MTQAATAQMTDGAGEHSSRRCRMKGGWSPLNIALMIIGFIVFWPLGLAMLAWIFWSKEITNMWQDKRSQFGSMSRTMPFAAATGMSSTGNVAFDEYRSKELKRIEEERRKLDEMRAEFDGFLKELRRVKDQEEFSRFMESFKSKTSDDQTSNGSATEAPENRI